MMSELDVRYPTLTYFRDGKKVKDFKGERTLKNLKAFVKLVKLSLATAEMEEKGKVNAENAEKEL